MAQRTYYDILCLRRGCAPEQIRKAYRQLVRLHHPDLHPGDVGATRRAQEINEAYETLSDPARQAVYDRQLDLEEATTISPTRTCSPEPTRTRPHSRLRPPQRPFPQDRDDEDLLQYLPRRSQDPLSHLLDKWEDGLDWELYRVRSLLRRLLR